MKRVRANYPIETRDWWCFCCACGEVSTSFDAEEDQPQGEMFECVSCGNWGHVKCYAKGKALWAARAQLDRFTGTVRCASTR